MFSNILLNKSTYLYNSIINKYFSKIVQPKSYNLRKILISCNCIHNKIIVYAIVNTIIDKLGGY